jgi:hypothetical protein
MPARLPKSVEPTLLLHTGSSEQSTPQGTTTMAVIRHIIAATIDTLLIIGLITGVATITALLILGAHRMI